MKTIIHTIDVKREQSRVLFQISLPRNATSIKGLAITAIDGEGYGSVDFALNQILGHLSLSTVGFQNVFFSEIIRVPKNEFKQDFYKPLQTFPFGSGQGWINGAKQDYFHLTTPLKVPFIEGFYQHHPLITTPYKIQIYLTLEL